MSLSLSFVIVGGRNSGTRRESEARGISNNSSRSQGRRVSIVRLNEPIEQYRNESQHQAAPVQLRLIDDRAASQYSSGRSDTSSHGGRRISIARVNQASNTYGNEAMPLQLRLASDSQSDGRRASNLEGRRISIVSKDGSVTQLKNVRIAEGSSGSRRYLTLICFTLLSLNLFYVSLLYFT